MWGVAVAVPYIFIVNEERKWYNQMDKLGVVKVYMMKPEEYTWNEYERQFPFSS